MSPEPKGKPVTSEILLDFVNMTMEEMDEWIDAEEVKTPFSSFDLGTDEGRQGLLRKYYMIGNTSLFEAVSHVWASLNEPKAAYCTVTVSYTHLTLPTKRIV